MTTTETEVDINPLLHKTPYRQTWLDWRDELAKARTYEQLLALTNTGFDIQIGWHEPAEQSVDRVLLYLAMADGWLSESNFDAPDERTTITRRPDACKFRQELSKRAYQVLVMSFFKNTAEDYEQPSWLTIVEHPGFLEKLLHFFRIRGNTIENIGYSDDECRVVVRDFLSSFWQLGWSYASQKRDSKGRSQYLSDEEKLFEAKLVQTRPDFVRICAVLKQLDVLLWDERQPDETCIGVLEELALKKSSNERYTSEAEASLAGSKAARVLMVLRSDMAERQRQALLRQAAADQRAAAQREADARAAEDAAAQALARATELRRVTPE